MMMGSELAEKKEQRRTIVTLLTLITEPEDLPPRGLSALTMARSAFTYSRHPDRLLLLHASI